MNLNCEKLVACHECDLLIELPEFSLAANEKMQCPRCRYFISAGHDGPIETVLALCITALITLSLACTHPFISFDAEGQSRTVSLLQTSTELYAQGFPVLSGLVFCFIILLPLVYLLLLIRLLLPIKFGLMSPEVEF
jgi:paraquat-inducible protein A